MSTPLLLADGTRIYNEDLVTTLEHVVPGIVENAIDAHPAMSLLFGNIGKVMNGEVGAAGATGNVEMTAGGDSVRINVKLGKNGSARRLASGFSSISTDTSDTARGGRANWKLYAGSVIMSGSQMRQNSGSAQYMDQLAYKTDDSVTAMVDLVAQDLLTTNSQPNAISSIPSLIGANDSVHSLSGATFHAWNSRGQQDKGTAAGSISFTPSVPSFSSAGIANWRRAHINAEEGSIKPDAIITTDVIYQYYEGSLTPQVRFQNPRVGDLSFDSLQFKNAAVFHDPYCASGETYFINRKYLMAKALNGALFNVTPMERRDSQDAFGATVIFEGQICISGRKFNNKISGQTA